MPSEKDSKRFYWLKLEKDFFKRHDIRIVEAMPNGKDYIIFYLKLLCESTSHEGYLRFSETIPYNDDMLATITNTNVDVVRSAIKVFRELNMIRVLDDGTLFLEQVGKMISSVTGQALRKAEKKAIGGKEVVKTTTEGVKTTTEIDIEKDKEIDIEQELFDKGINISLVGVMKPLIESGYLSLNDNLKPYAELLGGYIRDQSREVTKRLVGYFCSHLNNEIEITDKYLYFRASLENGLARIDDDDMPF